MDNFVQLPVEDREFLFRETADKIGNISPILIEKDFWVIWTLKHLFAISGGPDLVFRGGTTLSKVHGVIKRFSEDIDLGFDRNYFGFQEKTDSYKTYSISKRKQLAIGLEDASKEYVKDSFYPKLHAVFSSMLKEQEWNSELETDTLSIITLYYPKSLGNEYSPSPYISPSVKIELSARPGQNPNDNHLISSYVAESFPDQFETASCEVRVIKAERTFWEKATLLHRAFHRENIEGFPERLSRHCYDLVMMKRSTIADNAIQQIGLLENVIRNKEVFFYQRWARYDKILDGKLRLTPISEIRSILKSDYQKMDEMIFGEYPQFDDLITDLKELEERINLRLS